MEFGFFILILIIKFISEYVVCKICNVALCRTTKHSALRSGFATDQALSCNGVDGNHDYSSQTCVRLEKIVNNYALVDLGEIYTISHSKIWGLDGNGIYISYT